MSSDTEIRSLEILAATGDVKAYEKLFEICIPSVKRVLVKVYRISTEDAEDLTQDAIISIWSSLKYNGSTRFVTYFVMIAKRKAFDRFKLVMRHPKKISINLRVKDDSGDTVPLSWMIGSNKENHSPSFSENNALIDCLESIRNTCKISNIQYEVLRMIYLQGLKYEFVSKILGLPIGTVKSHRCRGFDELVLAFLETMEGKDELDRCRYRSEKYRQDLPTALLEAAGVPKKSPRSAIIASIQREEQRLAC